MTAPDGQAQLVARASGDTGYTLITAYQGMQILPGDTIETSFAGRVSVTLNDGSLLSVGGNSELTNDNNGLPAMQNVIEQLYDDMQSWFCSYFGCSSGGGGNSWVGDIGELTYPNGNSTTVPTTGDWFGYDSDNYIVYDSYYDCYYDYGGWIGGDGCDLSDEFHWQPLC